MAIPVFLAFFAVGLAMVNRWLDRSIENHYEKKFKEIYYGAPGYDIIFLGPSHTVHGVSIKQIEEETGLTAYNFGLNGSNPENLHSLYRFLLKPRKRIGTVALDTMFIQFDERWLWRNVLYDAEFIDFFTLLRYGFSDEPRIAAQRKEREASRLMVLLDNKIPFLKYQRNLPDLLAGEDINAAFDTANYYKGYTPYLMDFRIGGYGWQYYRGDVCYRPAHINTKWADIFEQSVREVLEEGKRVVLYQMPEYLEGREANIYEETDAIHRRVAAKYGVPFLNYNVELRSWLNYDKRYFYNWDHLNPRGAETFSKKFGQDLRRVLVNRAASTETE